MRFHYDKKIDALYIRFNEARYRQSDEVADGIMLDYDRNGKIVGIEVLDASKKFPSSFSASLRARKIPATFEIVDRVLSSTR